MQVSQETKAWFDENGLRASACPTKSPDFNITEFVWTYHKIELSKRTCHIKTKDMKILAVWNSIPAEFIFSLSESLLRRMSDVVKSSINKICRSRDILPSSQLA